MKKIIFYFVLIFMLAACGEKTNFQGRYEPAEANKGRVITLEKVNDVDYKLTEEPNKLDKVFNDKRPTIAVKIKNSNQLFDSQETYIGEFKENKDFVDNRGRVYKKVE